MTSEKEYGTLTQRYAAMRLAEAESLHTNVEDLSDPIPPTCSKHETLSSCLALVLNRFCQERQSNTPDYILAEYLIDCLSAYNKATVWVNKWNSSEGVPVHERVLGPKLPRPGGIEQVDSIQKMKSLIAEIQTELRSMQSELKG
jgi:hypothetical protein